MSSFLSLRMRFRRRWSQSRSSSSTASHPTQRPIAPAALSTCPRICAPSPVSLSCLLPPSLSRFPLFRHQLVSLRPSLSRTHPSHGSLAATAVECSRVGLHTSAATHHVLPVTSGCTVTVVAVNAQSNEPEQRLSPAGASARPAYLHNQCCRSAGTVPYVAAVGYSVSDGPALAAIDALWCGTVVLVPCLCCPRRVAHTVSSRTPTQCAQQCDSTLHGWA